MGINSSRVKTLQENATKKVTTARQDESEDDDSDATESSNIQLEIETYECLNGESEVQAINLLANRCDNKRAHTSYTAVEDLFGNTDTNVSLQLLPEAIRHESVLEFIKIHEKLVVRIRTRVRGETKTESKFGTGFVYLSSEELIQNRKCQLRNCSYNNGQMHENYGGLIVYTNKHVIKNHLEAGCCNVDFFYYNDESLIDTNELTDFGRFKLESHAKISSSTEVNIREQQNIGSFRLDSNDNIDSSAKDDKDEMTDRECHLSDSDVDINSLAKVDEITAANSIQLVRGGCVDLSSEDTSEHEVGSNEERDNNPHVINSHGLLQGITAYGLSLGENQENKDLVGVRIFYHDPKLFMLIKTISSLRMKAWSKIPEVIKRKMRKYAIIISHPHGWPKKISFGALLSLEETSRNQKDTKETTYNATTCQGSSGAPVVTGHYSYRPYVHKGKYTDKNIGFSHSY